MTMTDGDDVEARLVDLGADPVETGTEPAVPALVEQSDALDLPGVPDHSEFLALAQMAKMLSESDIAPKALRGKPAVAFHVCLIGRDLGLSPSAALQLVDVIDDQPSLSPMLRAGQIQRLGLGAVVPGVRTVERAEAWAVGPGGLDVRCRRMFPDHVDNCRCDVLGCSEFTWSDAQTAGLVRADCKPGGHSDVCKTAAKSQDWQKRKQACKQNYRTYPKRMLYWRAVGFCADDYFAGASLGIYAPDELGALTGEDGELLDLESVEVPPGYETAQDRKRGRQRTEPDRISSEDSTALRDRASALPDAAKEALREWAKDRGSHLRFSDFTAGQAKATAAFVATLEKRAEGGEWADGTVIEAVVICDGCGEPESDCGCATPDNGDTPDEPPHGVEVDVMDPATLQLILKMPDDGLVAIGRAELEAACRGAHVTFDADCDDQDLVDLLRGGTAPF